MRVEFNFINNKELAKQLAVILLSIALFFVIAEFICNILYKGFYFEDLVGYVFEFLFNGSLIYALIRKKTTLIEITLVLLKVYEGTYYPLRSAQRLDTLNMYSNASQFDISTHILFAIAAFSLLIALFLFCIYKARNNNSAWGLMKISILIATVMMVISTGFYIYLVSSEGGDRWLELFEPISLSILFFGMFLTCEYVEEDTLYA